jgi:hypothetical protein
MIENHVKMDAVLGRRRSYASQHALGSREGNEDDKRHNAWAEIPKKDKANLPRDFDAETATSIR